MDGEIKNRVSNSKLITLDLEDFYPEGKRVVFDISPWLYKDVILREKEFRLQVKEHDWSQYQDCFIAITNSSEAIIPVWAYLLLTVQMAPFVKKIALGSLKELETILFTEMISQLNIDKFKDKSVIIKGCTHKPIPENALILLCQKLHPIVSSIMYGEACSSVPLFKRK